MTYLSKIKSKNKTCLLGAASAFALSFGVSAHAQDTGAIATAEAAGGSGVSGIIAPSNGSIDPRVVVRSDIDIDGDAPDGALDNAQDVTGIGQMLVRPDQNGFGLGLCTGTLINPRTVLFAAHCVNSQPAESYGFNSGGTSIAFGFNFDNLPAVRQWLGLDSAPGAGDADPALLNATNTARNLYNVEEVWYDPRSLEDPFGLGFVQADIALATLDTPAFNIPTWALLFTPLDSETHVRIGGYGRTGTSGTSGADRGIDFRRRAAENMVSALASFTDRDSFIFGDPDDSLPQNLYWTDFDDPDGEAAFDPANGRFDFDIFDGGALPQEGTTAGGDSGSALIADQRFDREVILGVLSGGSAFFGGQEFSSYGTTSFYQPLFLYWDTIVANNPYRYVTNRAGFRNWNNPNHWFQSLDPNYLVERDGELVNALPGTPGAGVSGESTQFGNICFLATCVNVDADGGEDPGEGDGLTVEGGPGSTGFVPNNVVANPAEGIRAQYYDVTLSAPGQTRVTSDITIDRLTIDGLTGLDVRRRGNLNVLGDFTQVAGLTNVDGLLTSRDALIATGILSGSGRLDPTYLTVARAAVTPGGFRRYGTLTVQGDVILTSGSLLQLDIGRRRSDSLAVTGDADNPGIASLGGLLFLNRGPGSRPRFGQSFEIVTAEGGVEGTFDNVGSALGILTPELTYNENNVVARLRAGSFFDFLRNASATAQAFGVILDGLRASNYNDLFNLYGNIDLLDSNSLALTFEGLAPSAVGEASAMNRQQKSIGLTLVSDRLSALGNGGSARGTFTVVGSPSSFAQNLAGNATQNEVAISSLTGRLTPGGPQSYATLPENMSGFISGGFENNLAIAGQPVTGEQRRSWHFAMGLEIETSPNLTIGTSIMRANGVSNLSGGQADTETSQAVAYGTYRLGKRAYVAGLASATFSDIGTNRNSVGLDNVANLAGQTNVRSYDLQVETGVNMPFAKGLVFTPKVALRFSSDSISGFREAGAETALAVNRLTDSRVEGRIGAQLAGSTAISRSWTLAPQVSAEYVRRLDQGAPDLSFSFAGFDSPDFTLPGFAASNSWAEIRAGFTLDNGFMALRAGIESNVGRQEVRDQRAVAGVSFRF